MQSRSCLCWFGLVLLLGYRPPAPHPLIIKFVHFVGSLPLRLSTSSYTNCFDEPFTIEQCKYYVSDIRVIGDDAAVETVFPGSHLVDAADSSSLILHLAGDIPRIVAVRFEIGVDSSINLAGVQNGDLDPMLGMFWTWNTGYIYAKLEGQSDSAHAPAHRFTWDVGGYRPGANAVREITLPLQHPATNVTVCADLLSWFNGRHPIRLSRSPVCHQPGSLAMQLADNYSTMFSIAP